MPIPLLGPILWTAVGSVASAVAGIWFTKKYSDDVAKAIDNPEEAEKLAKELAAKAAIGAAGVADSAIGYVTDPKQALADIESAAASVENLYDEYRKEGSLAAVAASRFSQETPPAAPPGAPPAPPAPTVRTPEKPAEEDQGLMGWFKKQVMGSVPSAGDAADALLPGMIGAIFGKAGGGNMTAIGLAITATLLWQFWLKDMVMGEPEPSAPEVIPT